MHDTFIVKSVAANVSVNTKNICCHLLVHSCAFSVCHVARSLARNLFCVPWPMTLKVYFFNNGHPYTNFHKIPELLLRRNIQSEWQRMTKTWCRTILIPSTPAEIMTIKFYFSNSYLNLTNLNAYFSINQYHECTLQFTVVSTIIF